MYDPKPIDTTGAVLTPDIIELTDMIAANVHDIWARGRLDSGWTYGPTRDDAKKTSPCLLPYADLPDSEKAYDRNTALETLKLIITLGYEIRKKE